MKKLLLILIIPLQLFATKYYISPTGSDGGSGTYASPWIKLEYAWSHLTAGDTLYCIGGTYNYTDQQILTGKSGTAGNMIKVWSYNSTPPKFIRSGGSNSNFDDGRACSLIYFSGDYVWWKNIEVAYFAQWKSTAVNTGFCADAVNYCRFEQMNCHHNGHGMLIKNYCNGNVIINSDFHHNEDPLSTHPYDNADGLEMPYNYLYNSQNYVISCRFYWNSDDGIDIWYNDGFVYIINCWSFYNGYLMDTFTPSGSVGDTYDGLGNGFKLGQNYTDHDDTIRRRVDSCLAYKNNQSGFTHNSARCAMQIYHNTAAYNEARGIDINNDTTRNYLYNNIAYQNGQSSLFTSKSIGDTSNTFKRYGTDNPRYTLTSADFDLDTTGLTRARKSDGSLPDITLMHLKAGSDLIDRAFDTPLPYRSTAPDLGYWEYYVPSVAVVPLVQKGLISTYSGKVIKGVSKILKR